MYISTSNNYKLDEIIKSFEVALRSYVVEILKTNFLDESSFKRFLDDLILKIQPTSIMNSNNYSSKTRKLSREYKTSYKEIEDSYLSFKSRDIASAAVPYVGAINDYVEIFFDPYFLNSDLLKGFSALEYCSFATKYKKTRNDLSHPGSSKISILEAKEIFMFIKRVSINLDEKYFWYVSKACINQKIIDLAENINENPIKINNFDEIKISYRKKIIGRECELSTLKDYLFGSKYRNAGSIVIYGYGGLGKTALVIELVDEIIKKSIDDSNQLKLDYILFFTSKEEVLEFSQTTGDLIISPLKKQISSFEEFKSKLFSTLDINSIDDLNNLKGIIVIDNIETLNKDHTKDKEEIFKFIFDSPRTVQYIVTSREEEQCEQKLHLKGFDINNNGESFILNYIIENELDVDLQNKTLDLINSSKGNTLIIVLSLLRLQEKICTIDDIIAELDSTSSSNMEMMSLFMYKNTFDSVIQKLNNPNALRILSVISLYGEPIDLFSISKLLKINSITEVEGICNILATKLVLTKIEEQFVINEFANKFIFIKLRPNSIEERQLITDINNYKFDRRQKLRRLEDKTLMHHSLKEIMNDWQARTIPDKLAINEAFDLYTLAQKTRTYHAYPRNEKIVEEIEKRFAENELMSAHPYIKFQKAKIFQLLLSNNIKCVTLTKYLTVISTCFEDVILSINVDYKFMKSTKSYASVLWFYGQFLNRYFDDFSTSIRYLEESKFIYEKLGLSSSEDYLKILYTLTNTYKSLYDKSRNNSYNISHKQINDQIRSLKRTQNT